MHIENPISTCPLCDPHPRNIDPILGDYSYLRKFGLAGRPDLFHPIETDQLYVKPDIEPCHEDGLHFLIVPKSHTSSLASTPEVANDVAATYKRLENDFNTRFVILEHGGLDTKKDQTQSSIPVFRRPDQVVQIVNPAFNQDNGKDGTQSDVSVLEDSRQLVQSIGHVHAHAIAVNEGEDIIEYFGDFLLRRGIISQTIQAKESPVDTLREVFGGDNNVEYIYAQLGRLALIAFDDDNGFPSLLAQTAMSRKGSKRPTNWKNIPHDVSEAALSAKRLMETMDTCRKHSVLP